MIRRFLIAAALGVTVASCQHAPPSLSPAGAAAFKGTQAIKALDTLRDIAIAANAQTPPLLNTNDTRKVVLYHQSSVRIIRDVPSGWVPAVLTGLNELKTAVPSSVLVPYLTLVQTVISEVSQ